MSEQTATRADAGAHPLAKRLWYLLHDRSEADRRLVYEALRVRLGPREQTANQEIAVAALQRFAAARRKAEEAADPEDELPRWATGSPSRRHYNLFREAQDEPRDWPSTSLIANAFGRRWGDALQAAGLASAPDVLARRILSPGTFSRKEIESVLRTWIAEVDRVDPDRPLRQSDFVVWGKQQRSNPNASCDRVPSLPTLNKYIGGWEQVLGAFGLAHRCHAANAARFDHVPSAQKEWAEAAVEDLDLASIPRTRTGRGRSFSLEDVLSWIRWLTASLGREEVAELKMRDWNLLRAALLERLGEANRMVDVPSAQRIASHTAIPSWAQAKVMAGCTDPGPETANSHRGRFDDEELAAALAGAAEALGRLPTRGEYETYRKAELAERLKDDPWFRLPSEGTLRMRLAKTSMHWNEVLESLVARHPELAAGRGREAA